MSFTTRPCSCLFDTLSRSSGLQSRTNSAKCIRGSDFSSPLAMKLYPVALRCAVVRICICARSRSLNRWKKIHGHHSRTNESLTIGCKAINLAAPVTRTELDAREVIDRTKGIEDGG